MKHVHKTPSCSKMDHPQSWHVGNLVGNFSRHTKGTVGVQYGQFSSSSWGTVWVQSGQKAQYGHSMAMFSMGIIWA